MDTKSRTFIYSVYRDQRDLHSFPTRRSSDLRCVTHSTWAPAPSARSSRPTISATAPPIPASTSSNTMQRVASALRSEEHTSELQSRRDIVCRLLREKQHQCADQCTVGLV